MSARVRNLIWIFTDKIGLVALSILSFLFFAYYLTPQQLGEAVFVIAIFELFGVFINMMIEDPLIRRNKIDAASISTLILFGTITTSIIILSVTIVSFLISNDFFYSFIVFFAGLKVVFTVISRPFIALLRKERKFKKLAMRTLIGKVVGSIVAISCASLGYGSIAVISQGVVMELVALVTLMLFSKSWYSNKVSLSFFIEIVKEGTPAAIKTSCNSVYERGVIIILGIVTTAEIVGLFSFGKRLIELPLSAITTGLTSYSVPALSSRSNDSYKQALFLKDITTGIAIIFVPIFSTAATFGGDFIGPIFGEKWLNAVVFFQLFSLVAVFKIISIFIPGFLVTNNSAKIGLVPEVLNSLLGLAMLYSFSIVTDYRCVFLLLPFTDIMQMMFRFRSASKIDNGLPRLIFKNVFPVIFISLSVSSVFFLLTKTADLNLIKALVLALGQYLAIMTTTYLYSKKCFKFTTQLIKG